MTKIGYLHKYTYGSFANVLLTLKLILTLMSLNLNSRKLLCKKKKKNTNGENIKTLPKTSED